MTALSPLDKVCADALADEVAVLVRRKVIDSRSPAADALRDYREPPSTPRADRMAQLEQELDRARIALAKADGDLQREAELRRGARDRPSRRLAGQEGARRGRPRRGRVRLARGAARRGRAARGVPEGGARAGAGPGRRARERLRAAPRRAPAPREPAHPFSPPARRGARREGARRRTAPARGARAREGRDPRRRPAEGSRRRAAGAPDPGVRVRPRRAGLGGRDPREARCGGVASDAARNLYVPMQITLTMIAREDAPASETSTAGGPRV